VRFKLDENLPELVCQTLTELGHDPHTVRHEQLSGAPDPAVLKACVDEGRVLITLDLDFADIRAYPPGSHRGIWVLRPAKQTFGAIDGLVRAAVRLSDLEPVDHQLWIIDEQRIRIRDA
jgi:predicted nuclease of predicted toxin-antitoxin system